jgi:hypothetical protein
VFSDIQLADWILSKSFLLTKRSPRALNLEFSPRGVEWGKLSGIEFRRKCLKIVETTITGGSISIELSFGKSTCCKILCAGRLSRYLLDSWNIALLYLTVWNRYTKFLINSDLYLAEILCCFCSQGVSVLTLIRVAGGE